jgi:hypothetical protein
MFGLRSVVFACALFGAAVTLPLDLAEARTHQSDPASYSQYLRKSYARHHAGTFSQYHARRSYAHHATRKSAVHHSSRRAAEAAPRTAKGVGARPSRWCGWWMRTQKGGGPELNLARNWAHWGRPSGPQVGAVVVWPHHVGMITGRSASGQWIVKSGNDGGTVRARPRSVAGAVFRVGATA